MRTVVTLFLVFVSSVCGGEIAKAQQKELAAEKTAEKTAEKKAFQKSRKSEESEKDSVLGIVKDKPKSGHYVATPMGFMVPYKQKIPGTKVTFEMIPVPGGLFEMGSPKTEAGRSEDEGPLTRVDVAPYWIAKTEVTWREYQAFMDLRFLFVQMHLFEIRESPVDLDADVITAPSVLYDPVYIYRANDFKDSPAVAMTHFASRQYTKWLTKLTGDFYRLPTESEWEFACRAGSKTRFSFGDDENDLDKYGWYSKNTKKDLNYPVAQKLPNAWGIYDMHGNVAEWVLDRYTKDGYWPIRTVKDRTETKAIQWATKPKSGLVRGGSIRSTAEECRSASRLAAVEQWQDEDPNFPQSPFWNTSGDALSVGFRIVRPLVPPVTKERAKYWDPVNKEHRDQIKQKVTKDGRGAIGVVDPKFLGDVEKYRAAKKNKDEKRKQRNK